MKTNRKQAAVTDPSKDANVLSIYLKEINRIPLLTREQEDLHARAAAGSARRPGGDAADDRHHVPARPTANLDHDSGTDAATTVDSAVQRTRAVSR